MKAEIEPEMSAAPEVEAIEEDPEPRKMQVTNADKEANTEAWKRYQAGDSRYEFKNPTTKAHNSSPTFRIILFRCPTLQLIC
jgi:hypothetical protein